MGQSTIDKTTLFEGMTQSMPILAFVLDEQGRFKQILANEQTSNLLYADPSEVVGKTIFEIFPAEKAETFAGHIDRALESATTQQFEYHLPIDDKNHTFKGYIAPLTDGDNPTLIWVAEDITDRVELEAERQRQHEHLIRTEKLADTGGWEYIPSEETVEWTEGTRRLFDVPDDFDLSVEAAFGYFHPNDREKLREAFDLCLDSGVSYSLDLRIVTGTGRQRWVQTSGARIEEDGVTKLVGVVQDITEHKLDEQRLMVLNRVLRHNLRNQLTVVTGFAERLEGRLPADVEANFAKIRESAESLLSLAQKSQRLNQALEFDYTTGPVVLEPLLEDLCEEARERYPAATVETDLQDVEVPANETGLRLIFEELVTNALKHAESAEPWVRVGVSRESDKRVAVSVNDDGPGLPKTEQEVLDLGEETALVHSDGMGLWMVNWVVTKFSGGIDIESSDSQGTTITIILPAV